VVLTNLGNQRHQNKTKNAGIELLPTSKFENLTVPFNFN
jgi:hypothetical protein